MRFPIRSGREIGDSRAPCVPPAVSSSPSSSFWASASRSGAQQRPRRPSRRCRRSCSRGCAGARSGRTAAGACSRSPACPAIRPRTTSAASPAASGRRPTAGCRGCRCSTSRTSRRSARSRSRPRIRTSSTSAAARRACAATSRTAPASTGPPTRAGPGRSVGLRDTRHIGRVIVDPKDPDRVFVAALGHAFGPNAERGVFRTTDGGAHWQKVLFKDSDTGAIDVQFDPSNANVVYAALWQVRRQPWNLSSGGRRLGPLQVDRRRHDLEAARRRRPAGRHLRPHRHRGLAGRLVPGVRVDRGGRRRPVPQRRRRRDLDAGELRRALPPARLVLQPHLRRSEAGSTRSTRSTPALFRSIDGGKTFDLLPAPHGDHHGLWIDPADPRRMINGNDGGATITVDGGKTWTRQDNQPTAQFYHVITDDRLPVPGLRHAAGQLVGRDPSLRRRRRDRSSATGSSSAARAAGSRPTPRIPTIVYGDSEHAIFRYERSSDSYQDVSVVPLDVSGRGAAELAHRFQWTTPLIAPRTSRACSTPAARSVWRSADEGKTWTAISRRSHAQRQVQAAAVGRADPARHHERRVLRHGVRARRVAAREGHAVGRHRRRPGLDHARHRQGVEEGHAAGHAGVGHGAARSIRRRTPRRRRTWRWIATGSTICGRTRGRPGTAARRWTVDQPRACRPAPTSTSCARIPGARACSTRAPSWACSCRSTTARAGSR